MIERAAFKVLAKNDTAAAPGHQGGIVIPKDIEGYFPDIVGEVSPALPTADAAVRADLIISGRIVDTVDTRYQHQTWGAERQAERRLTANLGPIRRVAQAGDIVVFGRDPDNRSRMSLELIRQADPNYREIRQRLGTSRWGSWPGPLNSPDNGQFRAEARSIEALELSPFELFPSTRRTIESRSSRMARSAVFRSKLLERYGNACAVSGDFMEAESGRNNLDGAHIVPVEQGGSDDPRNGMLLSKDFHWAFDNGLFVVTPDYRIEIPRRIQANPNNNHLQSIRGRELCFGSGMSRPHVEAINWHRRRWL